MAVTYVGSNTALSTGTSIQMGAVPATSPGDLMIIALSNSTKSATRPAGWSPGDENIVGGYSATIQASSFYKVAVAGDNAGTFNITFSASTSASAILYVLRGVSAVLNHSARHDGTGLVTSLPAPALTVNASTDATVYFYTGWFPSSSPVTITAPGTLSNPVSTTTPDSGNGLAVGWGVNITAPGPATSDHPLDYVTFGFDLQAALPKIGTLQDAFATAGAPNSTLWNVGAYGPNIATAQNVGGQLNMTIPVNDGTGNGPTIWSKAKYDLTESSAAIQVVSFSPFPATTTNQQLLNFYLYDSVTIGNQAAWHITGYYANPAGMIIYTSGPSGQIGSYFTYDPTVYKWLKIREHAGTIYFDYSVDGLNWTNFNTLAETGFTHGITQLNAAIDFITEAATNPQQVAVLDNFNVPPTSTAITTGPGRVFYAQVDLGGGLRGINSADPVNAQDAATKRYVDTHGFAPTYPPGGAYWEMPTYCQAVTNSYAGGWASGGGFMPGSNAGLPPSAHITKLYASTKIRVKIFNASSWCTGAIGNHYYAATVNGGALQVITRFFHNRLGIRQGWPFGVSDFVVNVAGPMDVVFYVATDGTGVGWNVDTGDSYYNAIGLISEVP